MVINMEFGSLRSMAPSLGIPPHMHYDPTDAEDARLRLEWAKFLFRAGYRLRYPQETTATAILLFHRFLIQERVSKHRRNRDVILTTCLFLAGKVTEAARRLRDVINVLHMLTSATQDEPPLLDKAYWIMKERIVEFEQVLLRTIDFELDPPDPYRLLLNYARSLRLDRAATRTAWGIVNDTFFCPRALSVRPPAVVCAAIRIATRAHGTDRRLRWFSPPSRKRRRRGRGRGVVDLTNTEDDTGAGRQQESEIQAATPGRSAGRGTADSDVVSSCVVKVTTDDRPETGSTSGGAPLAPEQIPDGVTRTERGARGFPPLPGDAGNINTAVASSSGTAADAAVATDSRNGNSGEGEQFGVPWWGVFDAEDEEVELVCSELLALYKTHGSGDDAENNPASLPPTKGEQSQAGGETIVEATAYGSGGYDLGRGQVVPGSTRSSPFESSTRQPSPSMVVS